MQFPPQKQGTVEDEIKGLEYHLSYFQNILQTVTTFHAYIQKFEPILQNLLPQVQQIVPKLQPVVPIIPEQQPPIIQGQPSFPQNPIQFSPQMPPMQQQMIRTTPSIENFNQLDKDLITSKNVCDQLYAYLRHIVNQAPPSEEGRDFINELHSSFGKMLHIKDKLQSQRYHPLPENVTYPGPIKGPNTFNFGTDKIQFEKANEFSSLFKIPQNLVTSKDHKLIDSKFPTKQGLSYIEENFERENAYESLQNMHDELEKTQLELVKELKNLQTTTIPYNEFLQNPSFDLVREDPDYQQYVEGIEFLLENYKEQAGEMQELFNTFLVENKKLVDSLLKIEFDPYDKEYNDLLKEYSDVTVAQRTCLFINYIVGQLQLPQMFPDKSAKFCKNDEEVMEQVLEAVEAGDVEKYEDLMKNYKQQFPDFKKSIESDINALGESEMKLQKQLMEVIKKKQKQIDKQAERELQTTEERVDILQKRTEELETQMDQQFKQIREQYEGLIQNENDITVYPANLENILDSNSRKLAMKRWYKKRIAHLEKENKERETRLEQIKQSTEQIRDGIKQKHQQLDLMGKVPINKNLPRTLQEMKQIIECPLCGQRRDTVVLACGHTFCNACAKGFISKRNRNCPSCQTRFTQYDLKQFKYDAK